MNLTSSSDLRVNGDVVEIKQLNIKICSQISDLSGIRNEEISKLKSDPFAELLLNSSIINEVKKRIEWKEDSMLLLHGKKSFLLHLLFSKHAYNNKESGGG